MGGGGGWLEGQISSRLSRPLVPSGVRERSNILPQRPILFFTTLENSIFHPQPRIGAINKLIRHQGK
jgi:hypothetical protein